MLFASLVLAAATVAAPQAQPDPTIASTRGALDVIKGYVTKAAEQSPKRCTPSSRRRTSARWGSSSATSPTPIS